jgi:uracil-DNA glycosylase
MKGLLKEISRCDHCAAHLPLGPKPVLSAHPRAMIALIGQAPGTRVHASGIPWDDPSGRQLRIWLGMSDTAFYDPQKIAIIPMGFCYPGKGSSGDLAPRPECAPMWHQALLMRMKRLKLTILIGRYAQEYYLKEKRKANLTETVRAYKEYLPMYFPLPHPSPRNRFWLSKNRWFETDVLPDLKATIRNLMS